MKDTKKFRIANRISFIFFILYLLTFVFLSIFERNAYYLLFLIFPFMFLISLIINLLLKYDTIKPNTMEKISEIASIFNILFNGFTLDTVAGSLYVDSIDWEAKKKEIKEYPSITPTWLFVILFITILVNGLSMFLVYDKSPQSINSWLNLSGIAIIIASVVSIIFILLGMISSTFALYYNNGKKEAFRFWKVIGVVVIALIIIIIYCGYVEGFSIKDIINRKHDIEAFEQHKQNIDKTLNKK